MVGAAINIGVIISFVLGCIVTFVLVSLAVYSKILDLDKREERALALSKRAAAYFDKRSCTLKQHMETVSNLAGKIAEIMRELPGIDMVLIEKLEEYQKELTALAERHELPRNNKR